MDQARHQVHQGGLPAAVRADQAGDPGRNRETHFIDAKHFAVKAGDVSEGDQAAHFTTSAPRILRASMYRQMLASTTIAPQQHASGSSSPCVTRKKIVPFVVALLPSNSHVQICPIMVMNCRMWPHLVCCTALMVAPKPEATKKTPNISA